REQILHGGDPDRGEHLLAVGAGERQMTHSDDRWVLYASAPKSVSGSGLSATRILTSQPSPYGSSFTVSGASTTLSLTSSTSPERGAIKSETALTDSTSPYAPSFDSVAPTSGGS